MLNIAEELKTIYKNDMFPLCEEMAEKDLTLCFPDLDLTIGLDQIVDDSFELNENLCSEDDLVFGACEASKIKFTVADVGTDLKGKTFTIEQRIGENIIPLGTFKVDSCKKQDDLRFKDIIAYDKLKSTDVNVADWYNGLFPTGNETYTLKQFRESLLTYLGIEFEVESLPNDNMIVPKTIEPAQISGREVLRRCVELQGAFGHIGRYGKFTHKVLPPAYGLYPAETLYPAEDLYPASETDTSYAHETIINDAVSKAMYRSVRFQEYTVKEIDKLQIRSEENDIGAIVGTGTNTYVIEGNFLVFGKSASELELIARNAYGNMAKRPYRPFEAESIGLPYIEVGDSLQFATDDPVTGYVLQRTLTGIQALKDEYIANGNEEREQNFGVNKEIIQLQGKVTRIRKDVEGVSVEVEDLANDTASKFTQTAEQIELRVEKNGVISAINQSAEEITIQANKINFNGYVTFDNNGNITSIDGSILETGTVIADKVRANWVYTGGISAAQVTGTMTGVTFKSLGAAGSLEVDGAYIRGFNASGQLRLEIDHAGNITAGNVACSTINGYQPITRGNIGSQSVAYADEAGDAFIADNSKRLYNEGMSAYVYVSSANNFRPYTNSGCSCGTSEGKWSSVWALNGTIQTSDERQKMNIKPLADDERFLRFTKMIAPYIFQMIDGTSGRYHVGFIAQRIEEVMIECGISDMEFAGLIKAPIYAKKLKDEEGNDLNEYDTSSEIIDYSYHLRYEEFIPLIFLWLRSLEN